VTEHMDLLVEQAWVLKKNHKFRLKILIIHSLKDDRKETERLIGMTQRWCYFLI